MRHFPIILSTVTMLFALPAHADTWLFAAAACPPWKATHDDSALNAKLNGACQKDVDLIVKGFQNSMDVADDHVITLIDAQATGADIVDALARLASEAKPEDRVVIYINTHGGKIEALYKGYEVSDEIFAWYTDERPADAKAATANGDWMTARDFRDHVNKIMSHEIVTIIEACHADAALQDYINNVHQGIGERGSDWNGREAVIFSSFQEQIANFTPDNTEAMFTQVFSDSLSAGNHASLFDAFEQARVETHHKVRENCAKDHTLKELVDGWQDYRLLCTQMPNAWDPFGLLDDISLERNRFGDHDGL
ncbi:MAG: hypothetical protein V3V13_11680 [Paracoccaceae bacterium]